MITTVNTIADLRQSISQARSEGKRIAFVPTMGNLHEGHLSLIDEAKKHGDYIVASIFVNPMQFGKNEDLDAYPRTLDDDTRGLDQRGCHLLFAPGVSEIYPGGTEEETRVDVPGISGRHCGASRPGHFTGVATVVSKLFNMVQPDIAIFGEKDFQQLAVIRKFTRDLCFPIQIVGVPTSRETSGLARSSRNGYLSEEQLVVAANIYKVLNECKHSLTIRHESLDAVRRDACTQLENVGFKIDYFNIADPATLEPAQDNASEVVILVAAWLGSTRLIDNMVVSLK